MNHMDISHNNNTAEMRECITNCADCHNMCVATIAYCLHKGGQHAEARHIQTLRDCAALCAVSADAMLSGSGLHHRVCGVCAEACQRCAESCEKLSDDQQMKNCADMCRRCAESCEIMAAT